jgi:hypothetical protein
MNSPDNSSLITTLGVGAISVVGAISKSAQWRDAKTGKFAWPVMFSGVAVCLIMASIVRAAGVHFGIEPWAQVMFSGVFCYVGPDPIIRAVAGIALKKLGVSENGNADSSSKP